ncbi:hypothetical protein [Eubacterium ruminantium]|nr:hypothetical protein [Eubacterium ruminantium]
MMEKIRAGSSELISGSKREAYEYGRINDQKVWRKEKWEKLRDTM